MAGFSNVVEAGLKEDTTSKGLAMTLGVNVYETDFLGARLAGIANISDENSSGIDVAGLWNFTQMKKGIQATSLFNSAELTQGIQVSGICNYNETEYRDQSKKTHLVQLSGITNISKHDVKGMMVSIFYNTNEKEFKGLQLAGFNKNKKTKGLQIGILNDSESLSGVQIGLFNFKGGKFVFLSSI